MHCRPLLVSAVSLVLTVAAAAHAQSLAPTPPMGWNSWDAYGLTIDEADFKANATVLAGIKQYGWQYAVIDEGWYMEDPFGVKVDKEKFDYDANGRLIPALNRFPDAANGAGLKPLADWVHAQGLKFGIHLVRGIPRADVAASTPIAGSTYTAADAGDPSDVCPWDEGNYGMRDNAAGQAWYDSMIGLYASWGVDYLKVDCISDHPYKADGDSPDSPAIQKTGRPIVLSLSPGPTASSEHAAEVAQYAQMWRIADDHWDVWSHDPKNDAKARVPLRHTAGL
jgi:alpha-galactosidase